MLRITLQCSALKLDIYVTPSKAQGILQKKEQRACMILHRTGRSVVKRCLLDIT